MVGFLFVCRRRAEALLQNSEAMTLGGSAGGRSDSEAPFSLNKEKKGNKPSIV